MPLDPFTGQQLLYGQEPIAPLPMRMMESAPGITAGILFNAGRGSRTMLAGGGFMDDARLMGSRRAAKYGAFQTGSMTPTVSDRAFTKFGRKRGLETKSGLKRDPFMHGARVNNVTMRPRALRRLSSLSVFSQAESGLYSYAGGVRALGKMRFGPLQGLADNVGASAGESILGPGLFSALRAGSFSDKYERKLFVEGKQRYAKKLEKINTTINRLAGMNNPQLISPIAGLQGSQMSRALNSQNVGVRGNLLVSSLGGEGTQFLGGFARGAMGFADAGGLSRAAAEGAERAVQKATTALGKAYGTAGAVGRKSGTRYLGTEGAQALLKRGLYSELGVRGLAKFAGSKAGAQVLVGRAAGTALKVASPIGTAMLVYDLAKMGGEIVKSGINLARDAEKSLQGSFSKPTFGMGYRDTEAAATSRSRGVMAIQNSRLNARSMLGSERIYDGSTFWLNYDFR